MPDIELAFSPIWRKDFSRYYGTINIEGIADDHPRFV